jgi:hypothetical protein
VKKKEEELIRLLAAREGKKKKLDIAQIREVFGIMCDLYYEDPWVSRILWKRGYYRALARRKGK